MKSILKSLKIILVLVLVTGLNAQESSLFNQNSRLAALAKVWGVLKYYHPKVATGEIDWDKVLVDSIDKIKNAATREEFNEEINNIIKKAGGINFQF